jgi:Protein  of unknown function (DUF3018)
MLHVTVVYAKILHVTVTNRIFMGSSTAIRVQKHRLSLRNAGLRPIQLWVPDTRVPGFNDECARQSSLAAMTDRADRDLISLLDNALADLGGA